MKLHFERLQEYRDWSLEYLGRNLYPYTQLRHVLYRYNNGNFDGLMFAKAKENFNRWDTDGSVFKGKCD